MTRSLAVLSTLALVGCLQAGGAPQAPDASGEGEITFALAGAGGAAIVVPVHINGQGPLHLVLDTGATFTCLDRSVTERLDLPEARGMVGRGATIGGSGSVSLHRVDTLTVGTTTAKGLTVCGLDLRGINDMGLEVDGLLGLNFLKAFKVGIDFKRNILSLSQP